MNLSRRHVLGATLASTALSGFAPAFAQAQSYPSRSIRVIIPNPVGGGTDIMGRVAADAISAQFGQPVVVDNRVGGSGMVAADAVLEAPADGYTLFALYSGVMTVNPALYKDKLRYDSLKDFVPVTPIAEVPNVLVVNAALPVQSVDDLIKLAKSKPGKLNYASSGNGVSNHLAMELFKQMADVDITHIPYKGGAPAMTDLIGGQVDVMFNNMAEMAGHIKNPRLRILAVATGKRIPMLPEVPTVAESGLPGYEVTLWYGMVAKAGTSPDIVEKLNAAVRAQFDTPAMRTRIAGLASIPMPISPAGFRDLIAQELVKWKKVVDQGAIKVE
jgi:tripartite-type tricarboxylate transporter receptor subunit TctC